MTIILMFIDPSAARRSLASPPCLALLATLAGCGAGGGPAATADAAATDGAAGRVDEPAAGGPGADAAQAPADAGLVVITDDPADQPLAGLTAAERLTFLDGDGTFDTVYRQPDGLGPLYIRTSCAGCHAEGGKGPGSVTKFRVIDASTRAPVTDPPEAPQGGTERPYAVAGATRPLLAPAMALPGHELVMSRRIGPTVMGRGYLEAIADAEIERVAAEQARRTDGIKGRINRVTYHSRASTAVPFSHELGETGLIGRFGLKARVPTLDDFAADAFQGDMGMTSPLRPSELPNPEGLADDLKAGVDVAATTVATVAAYVRTIAIPERDPAAAASGAPALFERALCSACHVPSLKTRADFPVAVLAGVDAPVYTDLLLHDMGEALADYQTDESAGPREWRTAPLIALRFQRSFMHDGRARTIAEAVLAHGGAGSQANVSVEKWNQLSEAERSALVRFVLSL
jgi:CxxC motif-containing protein (DUF1111 family)